MTELELKFGVPADMRASLRKTLLERGARPTRLQAHYFDTADGLLSAHRAALRVRREGRQWVQTIKAPGEGAVHRLEHDVALAARGAAVPAPDLQRHAEGSAAHVVARLKEARPGLDLVPRHGTDVSRLLCVVDVGATKVEVALDSGSAHAGQRQADIYELELEHKAGPVDGLFELAAVWVEHGGLWLSTISKAERGERLMRDEKEPKATRFRAAELPADAGAAAIMRALLQAALEQVLANASEVVEGRIEADTIHQLRVGLRRLRTVVRELGHWSPRIGSGWDAALGTAFAQLGQLRDGEAVAAAVRPLLDAARAPRLAWQAAEAPDPQQVVRERGFQLTLLEILSLAHAGDAAFAAIGPAPARAQLAARLSRLHKQISADARRFERLSVDDQHRVRKRLKRLRYLVDFTAALWPQSRLRRYLKRVHAAQEALGAHNDVAVAADAFRGDAQRHPDAWFAAGWLQAHLAVTARDARKALQRVASARVCWTG